MLDLIIKFETYEIEIAGQKVTMELRPLKREHMILLSSIFNDMMDEEPNVPEPPTDKKEVTITIDPKKALRQFTKNLEYQKYAEEIFKNYVKNIQGLRINGAVPTPEDFANEPALCNITIQILTELIIRSNLKFNEAKN